MIRLLALCLALFTASCTTRDIATGFQKWCDTAPNCTDHDRRDLRN